jgi:hypothetical protein
MSANTTTNNGFLIHGADHRASDMHVQSGYPIWNLIADWIANQYNDTVVIEEYQLNPAEWAAAKQYYLDHRAVIDARIISNQEPFDHEIEPGVTTPEDFFTWTRRAQAARASE